MNTKTILLADDDDFCSRALERFLKLLDYDVVIANDGDQAIEVLNRLAPELCVIDYHLPGAAIDHVVNRLRELYPDTPFVIVTGDQREETERMARSLSPDFFFVKPINMPDFKAVIENILSTRGVCK